MFENAITKLKRMGLWNLLWFSLVLSEVFTALMNTLIGLIRRGRIDNDLLLIGSVDAFVVGLAVTALLILIVKEMRRYEKSAEGALRITNDRLLALINTMPDMVIFKDISGRHVIVNRAVEEVTGHAGAEIIGKTIEDLLPPGPAADCRKSDEEAMRQSTPTHSEERVVRKDGRVSYFDMVKAPLADDRGSLIGLVAVGRDVTESKIIQGMLEEKSAEQNAILENALVGIAFLKDRRFLWINEKMERMFGYQRSEVGGLTTEMFYPSHASYEQLGTEAYPVLAGGGTYFTERLMKRKDGSCFWCSLSGKAVSSADMTRGSIWVLQDVNERNLAEDALRKSEELLRQAVRVSQIGIFDHDHRAADIYWSPEQRTIYGWGADEAVTLQAFLDLVHPADREKIAAAVRRAHDPAGGGLYNVEHRILRRDGEVRWLSTQSRTFFEGEGAARSSIRTVGASLDITERKRMEQSLRESEEKFRSLFDSANDAVFILSPEGKFIDVNRNGFERLGYTKEEMLSLRLDQIDSPEFAGNVSQRITQLREHGHGVFESAHVRKDGVVMPVEINARMIDVQGNKEIFSVIRDITERKRVENTLRTSEARLNDAQRIAHVGNWEWDIATNEVHWSDELYRIYGYEPREVAPDYDLVVAAMHPDSKLEFLASIDAALKGERSLDMDYTFYRKDGSVAVLHTIGRVYNKTNGKPMRMAGIVQDITEQKQAQEQLRESEEKFRSIFDNANDGILIANVATRKFFTANRTLCRMLGYNTEEITGLGIADIHPANDLHHVLDEFEKQMRGEKMIAEDLPVMKKDGSVFYADIGAATIMLGGEQYGIGIFRDITERKKAEQALREKTRQLEDLTKNLEQRVAEEIAVRTKNEQMLVQQSKLAAMGEMLGAIAHQWRQPLNVVGLIVQNLEERYAKSSLDRDYMEQMVKKAMAQIMRMSKTIDDFRNFYKPDRGKTIFDAMRAVGDVLSLVSAQLAADHIAYRLTCHTHGKSAEKENDIVLCDEKNIEGYRNEFEHVVLNLVNNARDAIIEKRGRGGMGASEKGLLSFDFYNIDGKVVLKMSDNGGGIPPRALNKIFDPYFTTKEPTKGTGLGLYMSKIIVEEHMQGKLRGSNDGQGAVFIIELPNQRREVRFDRTETA
jgi:PAS domain S-box-containing protein